MDEDTGEVVSIHRNEVIIESDSVSTEEHVELILDAGADSISSQRRTSTLLTLLLSTTRFRKIIQTLKKRRLSKSTVS